MCKYFRELQQLMDKHGFVFIRQTGGHGIWRDLRTGRQITTSMSPSDRRTLHNIASHIRQIQRIVV